MEEPFLYKGTEPIEWSFSQVSEFVGLAIQLNCLDELNKYAEKQSIVVKLPTETVNFVKDFLFKRRYHKNSESARAVITSATCPKRPDPEYPR
ncbi:hypothetical protein [Candidatus Nitrotoga sp. AM1P]|uniref:hypothetical protein n=1 Tax=Candidatus Nitrotoga sp. AM1P TaxID=2559597 RepID=UPI0010BB55F4|nr:hypothetical protein [Candidatus Nitrotoga sp. AM1P]BBJ24324.1 hypothetical protein W01_22510 [Candidatus Nitrotoga sp. AM1P]